jgi:hypothetical protein
MKPLLVLTQEGATADVLAEAGGAFILDPGDLSGIADAITDVYRSPELSATVVARRHAFMAAMSPQVLTAKLAGLLAPGLNGPA